MAYTSTTRLTGLASGIDTESYVEQLMYAESTRYYNYQRKTQKLQWQQEQYRTYIKSIQDFQSKWFDLTSSTSMRMQKTFNNKYKSSAVLGNGSETKNISISNVTGSGSHNVEVISKATTAKLQSSSAVSGTISETLPNDAEVSLKVNYDGTEKEITAKVSELETKIAEAFDGKVAAKLENGKLEINAVDENGTIENGHDLSLAAVDGGNFTVDKASNKVDTATKLSDLVGAGFIGNFIINDEEITVNADMTVKDLMNAVNESDAGVKMSYNSIAGMFSLESTDTGSTSKIKLDDSNGLFNALGFTKTEAEGENAKLRVDGVDTISASNELVFDEFTVNIKNANVGETVTINAEKDVDAIYGVVNEFVEAYNKLIGDINTEIKTKRPEGPKGYYDPLTDAEKEEMKEDDIKKWEEQAKKGLLYGDDYLEKFLSDMRATVYSTSTENSEGKSAGIYNYGITTTSDFTQGGKLVIDEEKLKKAITEEPETVMNLINGISEKMNDVVNKYTGTNGLMSNKVGVEGKASEFDNTMRTEINSIKDKMSLELQRLKDKEQRYYLMFAAMEEQISSNNSMLDSLYGYFS